MRRPDREAGASLIELVIAVTIAGIVAAIALPGYQSYRLKTSRSIGGGCLIEAQRRFETAYAHLHRYPSDLTGIGYGSASVGCGDQQLYLIALQPNTDDCPAAACIRLTATAQGSQIQDGNLRLTTYAGNDLRFNSTSDHPNGAYVKEHQPPGSSSWLSSWIFQPGH